jgi:hypothetical protein
MLSEIRFKLRRFEGAGLEMKISQALIEHANGRSIKTTRAHSAKILEAEYGGMSGH